MRVLVCGGRTFNDAALLTRTLDMLNENDEITCIIEGDARGADRLAGSWALVTGIEREVYPAKWDVYGKSAGYKRNMQMLVEGKPDLVVAFEGGKGTAMMVDIARNADVKTMEISR